MLNFKRKYFTIILFALLFVLFQSQRTNAESNTEVEENDSMKTATTIKLNTEFYGKIKDKNSSIYESGETDFYKVKIAKSGYFNIDFGLKDLGSEKIGDGWNVTVYDGTNRLYRNINTTYSVLSPNFPLEQGSTVYIEITPNNTNTDKCPTNVQYYLRVNLTESKNWESEDNDKKSKADAILSDRTYYGNILDKNSSLKESGESDYFKFIYPDNGYINMDLGPVNKNDSEKIKEGWDINIYYGDKLIYGMRELKENSTTANIPLKKGSEVYIEITQHNSTSCPTYVDYSLKVNFHQSSSWEKENNDEKSKANSISLNKAYNGNLLDKASKDYNSGETDYYKVKLSKEGYFNVTLAPVSVDREMAKDGWKLELYNGSTLLFQTDGVNLKTCNLSLKKGSTIYIKITPANLFNDACPTNIDYSIKVNFKESKYWEKESNDKKSEATPITMNHKYYGNIMDKDKSLYVYNEEDYYSFTAAKTGTITVEFGSRVKSDKELIGKGWKVILIVNNKVVSTKDNIIGTLKTINTLKVKKNDKVYIKIIPTDTNNLCPVYQDYVLNLKYK